MSNELALTVEQRLSALETKFTEEIDRIYNQEFPAISRRVNQIGLTALDTYNDTVQEIRRAEQGIKQANEFTEATILVRTCL